jgi:hypothetical protein
MPGPWPKNPEEPIDIDAFGMPLVIGPVGGEMVDVQIQALGKAPGDGIVMQLHIGCHDPECEADHVKTLLFDTEDIYLLMMSIPIILSMPSPPMPGKN